jgi:hypothetical protein
VYVKHKVSDTALWLSRCKCGVELAKRDLKAHQDEACILRYITCEHEGPCPARECYRAST